MRHNEKKVMKLVKEKYPELLDRADIMRPLIASYDGFNMAVKSTGNAMNFYHLVKNRQEIREEEKHLRDAFGKNSNTINTSSVLRDVFKEAVKIMNDDKCDSGDLVLPIISDTQEFNDFINNLPEVTSAGSIKRTENRKDFRTFTQEERNMEILVKKFAKESFARVYNFLKIDSGRYGDSLVNPELDKNLLSVQFQIHKTSGNYYLTLLRKDVTYISPFGKYEGKTFSAYIPFNDIDTFLTGMYESNSNHGVYRLRGEHDIEGGTFDGTWTYLNDEPDFKFHRDINGEVQNLEIATSLNRLPLGIAYNSKTKAPQTFNMLETILMQYASEFFFGQTESANNEAEIKNVNLGSVTYTDMWTEELKDANTGYATLLDTQFTEVKGNDNKPGYISIKPASGTAQHSVLRHDSICELITDIGYKKDSLATSSLKVNFTLNYDSSYELHEPTLVSDFIQRADKIVEVTYRSELLEEFAQERKEFEENHVEEMDKNPDLVIFEKASAMLKIKFEDEKTLEKALKMLKVKYNIQD